MLIQTLFLLTAMTFAVTAVLGGQLALARAATNQAAEAAVEPAFTRARVLLVSEVAAQINAGGPSAAIAPANMPSAATCPPSVTSCPLVAAATFAVTGSTDSGAGPDPATQLQGASEVGERRTSVAVTVTVSTSGGTTLVSRTKTVTLRTFGVPPFAQISGVADRTARGAGPEGDTSGCDGSDPTTCDRSASDASDDTRIHAVANCVDVGNGGTCPGTPRNDDNLSDPTWTNGNGTGGTWKP